MILLNVGDTIHGFCGGVFGRDSYDCRVVEAAGVDWIITRNSNGHVECVSKDDLHWVAENMGDRRYCETWCAVL